MCGRYVRRLDLAAYAEHFDFLIETPTPPGYNIAPTDPADVVRLQDNHRRHTQMSWGLVPAWDAKTRQINARSETVATSRMFKDAFAKRRCLVLADGIIEWQTLGKQKLPHLFTLKGDRPFAFAGIWNATPNRPLTPGPSPPEGRGEKMHGGPSPPEGRGESCAILTTSANALFARIHDRMPVVLQEKSVATWLDPDADVAALQECLTPFPAEEMTSVAISSKVNNARYKSADCLTPAAVVATASNDLFADIP